MSKLLQIFWRSANSLKMNPQKGILKDFRSSCSQVLCEIGAHKKFTKLTKSTSVGSLFRKVTGLHPSVLFRKRLWNRCFSVHCVKFVREPFYRTIRSSHHVFCKNGVLRNLPKFIRKHLYQSLNKVAGLRPEPCNFIKKETLAQVVSSEFCEISNRTPPGDCFWCSIERFSYKFHKMHRKTPVPESLF